MFFIIEGQRFVEKGVITHQTTYNYICYYSSGTEFGKLRFPHSEAMDTGIHYIFICDKILSWMEKKLNSKY